VVFFRQNQITKNINSYSTACNYPVDTTRLLLLPARFERPTRIFTQNSVEPDLVGEPNQEGGSGGGGGRDGSKGGRWSKEGRPVTNSAASTGLYHRSNRVNVVGFEGQLKRWEVVCGAMWQSGQMSSAADLMNSWYEHKDEHFPDRS
jgi:hypothetical protein